MKSIRQLDPVAYKRHLIHGEERTWIETNCYVDVLLELLHALGHEPIAGLPFTFCIDFEGDQWTFFKYPHIDLQTLYGLDLQELNPWNNLAEHIVTQVEMGRPILVELDSFYLPDTAGTAYQLAHVKSTVAVNEISIADKHMGYFHGQGYYHLSGENFDNIFQIDGLVHQRMLPPYVELVKFQEGFNVLQGKDLLSASLSVFKRNLKLLPSENPFEKFQTQFDKDFKWLLEEPIETFHDYSFATIRQYGACFELCETYLRWLNSQGEKGLENCIDNMNNISNGAKTFQFQLARSMARKREISKEPLDAMADNWQKTMSELKQRYL